MVQRSIRRVAVLSMNPWEGGGTYQPFSYAAYRIQAAIVGHPVWGERVEVRAFDAHSWSAERWVDEILAFEPDVVAGSTYIWSLPSFAEIFRRLRRMRPELLLVFGGPSARPAMLELAPFRGTVDYVDAIAVGEGEEVIIELLEAHEAGTPLGTIPGIAVPRDGRWQRTEKRPDIAHLEHLPSPFQLGLAPGGVSGHIETFRGCPMSCVFCQWGVGEGRQALTADYLTRELQAFREMNATGVYLVDAGLNLNAQAFRALREAEDRVGFIEDTELVCEVYPTLLKDEHLDFLARTRANVGLGLQSMDGDLLKKLQRPFDRRRFHRVVDALTEVAQTVIELIVGLPGDTPEQFRRTLEHARSLPCSVRVYHCLVLPDGLLTRAPANYAMDFDPITLEMKSCLGWSAEELNATFDYLTEEAEKHGGVWMRKFPRAAEEQDLDFHVGRTIGSSMWSFPDHAHEKWHRERRQVPAQLARTVGLDTGGTSDGEPLVVLGTKGASKRGQGERLDAKSRLVRLMSAVVARATAKRWRVDEIRRKGERITLAIEVPDGRFQLFLDPDPDAENPCYRRVEHIAFSYDEATSKSWLPVLDRLIPLLAEVAKRQDALSAAAQAT